MNILKKLLIGFFLCFLIAALYFVSMRASNQQDWSIDQMILPEATLSGDVVFIKHVRNFRYKTKDSYIPDYYDHAYNLTQLASVDYLVAYFEKWDGPAHIFLRFNFRHGRPLIISAEIRKEKGEIFSAYKGLLNQYELMYVLGDEEDLVKLRTIYRKNRFKAYRLDLSQPERGALLKDMLLRSEHLRFHPEFYNTLTNSCLTNIIRHLNRVRGQKLPLLRYQVFLPGFSPEFLRERGLIEGEIKP